MQDSWLHSTGLEFGAGSRNRTHDQRFTKPLLYQLSYAGPAGILLAPTSRPHAIRQAAATNGMIAAAGERDRFPLGDEDLHDQDALAPLFDHEPRLDRLECDERHGASPSFRACDAACVRVAGFACYLAQR